jgi:hypothetical protein
LLGKAAEEEEKAWVMMELRRRSMAGGGAGNGKNSDGSRWGRATLLGRTLLRK